METKAGLAYLSIATGRCMSSKISTSARSWAPVSVYGRPLPAPPLRRACTTRVSAICAVGAVLRSTAEERAAILAGKQLDLLMCSAARLAFVKPPGRDSGPGGLGKEAYEQPRVGHGVCGVMWRDVACCGMMWRDVA